MSRALLIVVSGPAGSGKTTLCSRLTEAYPQAIRRVITCTTRAPRAGEQDGKDYHFVAGAEASLRAQTARPPANHGKTAKSAQEERDSRREVSVLRNVPAGASLPARREFAAVLPVQPFPREVEILHKGSLLSLSGSPHDSLRASLGKSKFGACAACHGMDGKGNHALGAPNLTDDIWLHGFGENAIVAMINNGKVNQMPAHADRLNAGQIQVLASYVWGLANSNAKP